MARQMIDYAVDANDDLLIVDGDFVKAESTTQHQRTLLLCAKGDFKANPTVCVDATSSLDASSAQGLIGEIAEQFTADGMDVKQLNPNPLAASDNTARPFYGAAYK